MDTANFFNSYLGIYLAESFFHSLIAAVIIERAMHGWRIRDPIVRQRFLLIVIVLPVFSFPIYQLVNSDRISISFRLQALFDIKRWLTLSLWGKISLGLLFITILCVTTAVFLFQELIPVVRHTFQSRGEFSGGEKTADDSSLREALEGLPVERPEIFVLEEEELRIFSSTGSKPAVFISSALIREFSTEQLQAGIAHEIAHVERSRHPLLIIVFILRALMFFNPIVLVAFRRAVQEEEKICDGIAVSLTHDPLALSQALKKLYLSDEDPLPSKSKGVSNLIRTFEEYGHKELVKSRVESLERGALERRDGSCGDKLFCSLKDVSHSYG
jgi:Zn-dependent protease with chaperone function